jgi:hypothetical protein
LISGDWAVSPDGLDNFEPLWFQQSQVSQDYNISDQGIPDLAHIGFDGRETPDDPPSEILCTVGIPIRVPATSCSL